MRSLFLMFMLCSPMALAQAVNVQANSLLRLPGNGGVLQLEKLEVGDYGTLLVPAGITRMSIAELRLGHEARIAILPGEQSIELDVHHADLGLDSQISARGAPGTSLKAALPGRNLLVRIESLRAPMLSVDARGGTGAPGESGQDGANGSAPGCTWGAAGHGADGGNGGDGRPGTAGAQVKLELPRNYPAEQVKVLVAGGSGGQAGPAGRQGSGGKAKDCVVYRTSAGKAGRPGLAGQAGPAGASGAVTVQRF